MSKQAKIYFTGLNALRFFAAFLVVLHHGETIRAKYQLPNFEHYSLFQNGSLAVSFFFVLSGFLITFLLLSELDKTQKIDLPKFYLRRVWRIFPLYFLLVFIGLGIIPMFLQLINFPNTQPYDTLTGLAFFAFFLSFVVNALYGSHLLEPLWSIGVEEYFYLIWAPLFAFFRKNPLRIIVGMIAIKTMLLIFFEIQPTENPIFNVIKDVIQSLKFELMAVGGLGAHAVFFRREQLTKSFIFSKGSQILFYLLLFIRLFFSSYCVDNQVFIYKILFLTPIFSLYTEGVLFLWLILNTAINPNSFFPLTNRWLNQLGEISYGIYMYQMLVIFGVVLIFKKTMLGLPPSVSSLFFYVVVTFSVIFISFLSKKYFEDFFLRFKK